MKVNSDEFRVREGQAAILKKWPNKVQPNYKTDKQLKKILQDGIEETGDLQSVLYASNRYAVLLIFQAMDAAGKDAPSNM
jgi:polyphosphate kinase 2 (PPK2 family)